MLGLSIDLLDTLDDVLLAERDGARFIAEEGFADRFGGKFTISVQEGRLSLTADASPGVEQTACACGRKG